MPPQPGTGVAGGPRPPIDALAELAYELLDAHADTADLVSGLELDLEWASHLHYLRALQCEGRRVLAQMTAKQSV